MPQIYFHQKLSNSKSCPPSSCFIADDNCTKSVRDCVQKGRTLTSRIDIIWQFSWSFTTFSKNFVANDTRPWQNFQFWRRFDTQQDADTLILLERHFSLLFFTKEFSKN
ncbi:hypothetical protein CEXT_617211 [Caerostris extrusa]|uniref:Uncharacterized protein n=1 Tax=Caerostris extrusa TaxID=172846 RepID=A0AAV4XQQ7_CAEEX|nr:hypothetical protein CEXT_617211 [Caerostris extrusa]